jgi:drug/metabolite transporter (DMT)-like permease
MLVLLALSGENLPSTEAILWALAAGASGVIGVGAFYYALSRGTMGVIAPLTGLIGAGVPVLLAIAFGETVAPARLLGIVLALIAVVLTSLPGGSTSDSQRRRVRLDIAELPYIVVSGLGFAGFFLFVDRASDAGQTWWPLTFVRLAGLALVLLALVVFAARAAGGRGIAHGGATVLGLAKLRVEHMSRQVLITLILVVGLADLGGNVFFVIASQNDAFSVAVVLSSLYPVVTAILAAVFLRERLRPIQIVGVALATISVPLMR